MSRLRLPCNMILFLLSFLLLLLLLFLILILFLPSHTRIGQLILLCFYLLLTLTLILEIQLFLKHVSQLPGLMSVVRVASTLGVQGIEMGMAHRCVLAYSAVDLWEVGIVLLLPFFTHTDPAS